MTTGLLKCYYGYRNRGDELLMMGVIPYLFAHYDLTHLDVEVGDVQWIECRCELNPTRWNQYKDQVRRVTSRTFGMWIAPYDIIFAGGGEVLAAGVNRSIRHSGLNYLALFWRWIYTRRMVRLGGLETPHSRRSKMLYRIMLPYAQQIVCREQGSYNLACKYATSDRVVLYHDRAIDVLDRNIKDKNITTSHEKYIILNFIPKHTNPDLILQFHGRIEQYPDHQIINFPAELGDILPDEMYETYADRVISRKRREHEMSQSLTLFQLASGCFGQRLHVIIPCLHYDIPMHMIAYSEKVNKIIAMMQSQ